jgi:hypothetical protein
MLEPICLAVPLKWFFCYFGSIENKKNASIVDLVRQRFIFKIWKK